VVSLAARLDVRQGVVQRLGQGVLERLQQDGQVCLVLLCCKCCDRRLS
jgi:hypothetical protein